MSLIPKRKRFTIHAGTTNLRVMMVLGAALLLTIAAPAQKPVAELPRVRIDTTWNEPRGGTTWRAHTSAELSNALANSVPGDVIVLDAGTTYVGSFVVPSKENPQNKWIYIESSGLAKLPAGKRVSPGDAGNMPKIVTPNVTPAFTIKAGANHWRLAGLEITANSNYPSGCPGNGKNCMSYFLMGSQFVPTPPTPEPDSLTIDRSYVHGSPMQDLQSAVQMTASNYAVVDSYFSDVHDLGTDCQALVAYWTPGPIKIVNNYLEAASENVLFGGAGGPNTPYVPSDIEIRNNYLYKPLAWVDLNVNKHQMVVKNAFELKSAQRVLFDSNTIENVWAGGQLGFAIVLTVRSGQSGDVAVINDITITNNVLKNVVSGVNSLVGDDTCNKSPTVYPNCQNPGSADRWYIANNLITFYDPGLPGGARNVMLQLNGGTDHPHGGTYIPIKNVVFQHNTGVSASSAPCWNSIYWSTPHYAAPTGVVSNNIWILDNVLCRQPSGDAGLQGMAALNGYMGTPTTPPNDLSHRFHGNVMYVSPADKIATFPAHNLSTNKVFRYVDPAKGNYELLQPRWTETSDGKEAGIDFSTLPQ